MRGFRARGVDRMDGPERLINYGKNGYIPVASEVGRSQSEYLKRGTAVGDFRGKDG